jgi:hypothetical protein
MAAQNWIKVIDNESRIVFAAPTGFHGIVTIEKIPEVDVHTIEITGYTYWVCSSKKYSRDQKFNSLEKALIEAEKRMEQLN